MAEVIENKELKLSSLKKRSDFLRIAAAREKWISPAMIVQMCKKPENEQSDIRIGYTASKKVGNAVIRNRAKRRLREAAKQVLAKGARNDHDYVIIARREITARPFKELIRDLKWSLKRLHDSSGDNRSEAN